MLKILNIPKQGFSAKVLTDPSAILRQIPDGATVMVGGFGLCGIPESLIRGLKEVGSKNLTVVSNNCGTAELGLGILLKSGQIKRIIASYAGENHELTRKYFQGDVELELTPQGTLAEKIRSGGAGIPAFYTATGVGTVVETGGYPIKYKKGGISIDILASPKAVEVFHGTRYLREETIFGDYALIKASVADTMGNLVFNKTARNFNQDMVMAAKKTIVEVEEIVPAGELKADDIHVPGVYVDYIYKPSKEEYNKVIERLVYDPQTYKEYPGKYIEPKNNATRIRIAQRAAKEIKSGMYVNLGIGIPTLIPNYIDPSIDIDIHSEIGVFGVGPYPKPGQEDADLVNAGKESITLRKGSSIFSSSASFAIIRGGHLDLTILGAMQVSKMGDIANWMIPGKMIKGMGGAMDLVASGSKVMVVMEHTAKGDLKLLEYCDLPLTGHGKVDQVITNKAVFEKRDGELILTDIAEETSIEEVQRETGWKIKTAGTLKKF